MAKKREKAFKENSAKEKVIGEKVPFLENKWKIWLGPGLLMVLTAAMFGDILIDSRTILSSPRTDLFMQFISWREFGFGQLRDGHLALWNPYLFCGIPYFAGFQSALLYPLNLLYLLLPTGVATNGLIALHVFLAGLFVYFWGLRRGLQPMAAIVGGVLFMFSGPLFLHIYAGHLPNLCAMPWAPLLFLSIDGIYEGRKFKWCLLGMLSVSMQILAGHPQYVYYTAFAAVIYAAFRLVRSQGRLAVLIGLAAVFAGAAALTAVQLLPGMGASSLSIRGKGTSFEFAAMFSFPPENLITLILPTFFGDMDTIPYWGRCYLWEMSMFIGIVGLTLAIAGAIWGERRLRLFSLPMAIVLFLLSLGSHTPIFRILYEYVPGFSFFRGSSKFIFLTVLFLSMLAGVGLHSLLNTKEKYPRTALILWGCGLASVIGAFMFQNYAGKSTVWSGAMQAILATGESYLSPGTYYATDFINQAARGAARGMFANAAVLVILGGLFWGLKYNRRSIYVIALLAILEMFIFARSTRVTFEIEAAMMPHLQRFFADHQGDYRVLNLANPNLALVTKKGDIWGYDPGVSRRYAEFMAYTQNKPPDSVTQYLTFKKGHFLYRMLRLKYVLFTDGQNSKMVEVPAPLEHVRLIYNFEIVNGRDRIFRAMSGDFDPSEKVILESQPDPMPSKRKPAETGKVLIVDSSTDHLTIQADIPSPAILLITDGYNEDWRAIALVGSAQTKYEVMPANYVLMAVPLSAGHHEFRLMYRPRAFVIGKWISISSLFVMLGITYIWMRKDGGSSVR